MRSLEEYQVSSRTGFLRERACCRLPPAWQAYETLADSIAALLSQPDPAKASSDFIAAVDNLTEPPESAWGEINASLETQLYLHLCLTCTTAAYLWHRGETQAPNRLPAQLARPLHRVCESSLGGIQPIVSHVTLALANCTLSTDGTWSGRTEDLRLLKQPGPSRGFESFLLITCALEIDFAPLVPLIIRCASCRDTSELAEMLAELAERLRAITGRFDDFSRLLDPDEFYRGVRPFVRGHEGLVFEGVSEEPRRMTGASAAQSAILQTVDALLGVKHQSEFMADMLNYMLPAHRLLLADLASETRVPQLVAASAADSPLRAAHSRAVAALAAFRMRHIGLVSRYVVAPASRVRTDFASLAERGTGGQPLIAFLKEVRDDGLRVQESTSADPKPVDGSH